MFLDGQRESNRECFFVRKVMWRGGFGFRPTILSAFSRIGGGNLLPLRLGHVAGLVSVPRPATGLWAWLPGGGRESHHPNQQDHDASQGRKPPVATNDSLHAFVEES